MEYSHADLMGRVDRSGQPENAGLAVRYATGIRAFDQFVYTSVWGVQTNLSWKSQGADAAPLRKAFWSLRDCWNPSSSCSLDAGAMHGSTGGTWLVGDSTSGLFQ